MIGRRFFRCLQHWLTAYSAPHNDNIIRQLWKKNGDTIVFEPFGAECRKQSTKGKGLPDGAFPVEKPIAQTDMAVPATGWICFRKQTWRSQISGEKELRSVE